MGYQPLRPRSSASRSSCTDGQLSLAYIRAFAAVNPLARA